MKILRPLIVRNHIQVLIQGWKIMIQLFIPVLVLSKIDQKDL